MGDSRAGLVGVLDARVLWQVAEATFAHHLPGRRLERAAENPEQRRLAGAVAADDADLVAGHHREAGVGQEHPTARFDGETLRLEHRTRLRCRTCRTCPWIRRPGFVGGCLRLPSELRSRWPRRRSTLPPSIPPGAASCRPVHSTR